MAVAMRKDGTFGAMGAFNFVDAGTIADYIMRKGKEILLTVGLSYRKPRIMDRHMGTKEACDWLLKNSGAYVFEAWYPTDGDMLHVQALSGNDLY